MTVYFGSDADDRYLGDASTILGKGGNDRLETTNKTDTLIKGGKGSDSLIGGAGADILKGGKGNDYLTGGDGSDILKGGKGRDVFWFDIDSNGVDTIRDFKSEKDHIIVDGAAPDQISYDSNTGHLYYNTGSSDVHFATLKNAPDLTWGDIL